MANTGSFTTFDTTTGVGVGVATPLPVFNELDDIGLLLGQQRLPLERNSAYKQRLAGVFAQRANSTYRGLINGITRGLGLEQFNAISIVPVESGGAFTATNPAVIFNETKVYLYEDFKEDVLDRTIDRFDVDGPGYFLTDLVGEINVSPYFSASIETGVDEYTRSMTILNQSSHRFVNDETIPISTRFELENTNIVTGTIFFSDRVIFKTQVDTEVEVDARGKFWVDHKNGLVVVFDSPTPDITVRYQYLRSPMVCKASPVVIHNMQDDDFKVKLFEQVLTDAGTFENGLATSLGADIINELLSVYPLYWGE
jgi:hypothetical protein